MIDFRNPYVWDDLNDAVKLKLGATVPVRVYQSVHHALLEIGTSFQVLYSQKRQYLTSLASLGTHADDMNVYLSRQGIKGVAQDPSAPIDTLDDKKILFWVFDRDDAITGQKFVGDSKLKEDSKIFRIFVSHSLHLHHWPDNNIGETDIYILAHPETGGAVAYFGRRTQNINSYLCPTLQWGYFANIGHFTPQAENKSWVQALESTNWQGSTTLLTNISDRIYDRAIIAWKTLDASAIRDLLIRDHGVSPLDVECLSLSRWTDTRILNQFGQKGWDANTFRGTLILSARLSKTTDFDKRLLQTVEKLTKLSHLEDV